MDEAHHRTREDESQMVDEFALASTKDSYIDIRTESESSESESSFLDEFEVTLITERDIEMTEADSSSSNPHSSPLLSSIDDQNFADLLKRVDSSIGLTALRMRDGLYRRNSSVEDFAVTLITESDIIMTESDSSSSKTQSSSLLFSIDDQNFADLLKRVDSSTGLTALRMQDGLYRRNSSVEDFLSLAASGDIPHQDPALLQVPLMQHQQEKNERNTNYFLSLAADERNTNE
jgi:hypothetical protein